MIRANVTLMIMVVRLSCVIIMEGGMMGRTMMMIFKLAIIIKRIVVVRLIVVSTSIPPASIPPSRSWIEKVQNHQTGDCSSDSKSSSHGALLSIPDSKPDILEGSDFQIDLILTNFQLKSRLD